MSSTARSSSSTMIRFASVLFLAFTIVSCSSPTTSRSPRKQRALADSAKGTGEPGAEAAIIRSASAEEVARRALILCCVAQVNRSYPRAEERVSPATLERYEAQRTDLVKWLQREGAWEAATDREREILTSKVGTRSGREKGHDERESLLLMLWAVRLVKSMPAYDSPAPPISVLEKHLPEVGAPARKFLAGARLRPDQDIEREWEAAEIWHWRARAREVMRDRTFPQGKELESQVKDLTEKAQEEHFHLNPIRDGETFFRELIRFAAHHANAEGLIPPPIDDDFPARGKSYADLTEREFEQVRRIAAQRHHALSWIRGEEE